VSTFVAVLALLVTVAVAACCVVLLRRVRTLEATLTELELPAAPPLLPARERPFITVEVLNPIELATAQSRAGALVGSVRPQMVTKIVYDQVAKRVLEGLEEEGAVAEVRVHVAE
jgi:hypothetical protein